eukprot:XP_011678082.1 PREDICTED: trichohyalin [Strongylocentrotus purpuratus]
MDARVRDPGLMTLSPVSYEVESNNGFGSNANLDTSFELMSASQLRNQLRREQGKRREKEAEIDVLKRTTGSSLYGGSSTPKSSSPIHSRAYGDHVASNSQDSDSGISHGGSRKSPYHHLTPPQQSSSLPQVSNHTAYGSHSSSAAPVMPRTGRSSPFISSGYDSMRGGGGVLPPGGNASNGGGAEYWNTSPSSMKNMKDAMYESEQRRLALVEKLREAHDTLQNQTEKLCNSEGMLDDTHHTLANLSSTNEALQKRLVDVQKERDGSVTDKMDSFRQQGFLQQRVGDLERELKSLRAAHSSLQAENRKRDTLVDQTSRAMSLLDEENRTFQQTKDTMFKEALALKESIMIAKAKNDKLEAEVIELEKLNESREMLAARNTELNAFLMDERRQVAELMHHVELLKGDFMRASEERDVFQSRAIDLEDKCSDLNARCVSSSTSKERLMQEKLDLQQALNQTMYEKEEIIKIKQEIDSQLTQAQLSVTQHKLMVDRKEEELDKLEEELNATKKVSEVLSTELSLVKNSQERLQEEFKQQNADKRAVTQQQAYWEGEARRIAGERDILTKAMEQLKSDFMKEKEQFEEQIQSHRESTREARSEKTKSSARVQELETMLHRANEDLKEATIKQQEETEEWKGSCDRLSSSLARKESESAVLKEKLKEANEQMSDLRAQTQSLENSVEELSRFKETANELEEENKRLAQEHGEDQQVIQLLEMQKNILSKNQTTGVPNRTAEKRFKAEIRHLKAELGLSETRITELKEDYIGENASGYLSESVSEGTPVALRSSDRMIHINELKEMNKILEASTLQLSLRAKFADDTEVRSRDLDEQVRSMNDLNQMLGEKVSRLEKDKAELMIRTPKEDWVPKFDYDTIEKDKIKLEADYEILKAEYAELEARHQKFLQDHLSRTLDSSGLGLSLSNLDRRDDLGELRKLRQDNSSLERQVEVLRGQSHLTENGKKRAEDRLRQIEGELMELQGKMSNEREHNRYIADLEIETLLRAQLDEHKQIIKQLQTEVATKNVALENVTFGMEDRMVDKAREMERVIKERDEHSDARRRLEQEKLVLEIKIKEQKMLLEQLRDEKPRLLQERQGEISSLQEQLMSANKNVRKMENDVRNLEEQLSDKDHQLRRFQLSQSSEIEGMHEEATKQIKELQLQLMKKENEGSEMRQELNRREDEMRQVLQGKTKQELELDQIRGEAGRTVEHLTSIVEKQEGEIIRLRSQVEDKMEELRRFRTAQENDMESLKQTLSDTNKKYARLRDEKEMNETELQQSVTRQLQELRREMDRKEQLIKNMTDELEQERIQKPKLKEAMNEVEHELTSVRAELAKVNGTIKIKETQIQDQDNQLRDAHEKHDNLMREKMELKRKVESEQDNSNDELRELRNKLDFQKNELTILQDMNRAMEGKATKQIKELQLQLMKKENEGSEMRQELNRREDEMRQVLQGKTKQELELDQHMMSAKFRGTLDFHENMNSTSSYST